ncbi:hypothetical protein C7120_07285 [Prevotella sp. oral taxon 376]|uniref:DUF3990 domain-containing protein n=1 Tax=Prevotella sp. oral taxon 376 TaxID=712466 RepID=UPI000D1D8A7D|nr:DUF3990 domain-containing protein [Prevotella sp. oral taxon 376]PTL34328.1 hypothetical protein C7120_07285 [Prevotella sp. oral taxon 376]
MKLYHGTNIDFDKIDLGKSRPNKDFGQGFYLSDSPRQAEALAAVRVELAGGEPIVIEYDFDEKLLESNLLRVKRFDNYTEEWANFILANRNDNTFGTIHGYDIVIGPIANDRVGRQLWRYRNHDIDMPTLVRNLKYMKGITLQYFFGTERAISYLRKL